MLWCCWCADAVMLLMPWFADAADLLVVVGVCAWLVLVWLIGIMIRISLRTFLAHSTLVWNYSSCLPVKWKYLWKKTLLYSFQYCEKIWPLSPLYNSFHRLWLPFKEQSSALLPSPDILNYTFPFIQSSKGKGWKDKLLRSSWRRRLKIEVYNGLTEAWRPNIFNYRLGGKLVALNYINTEGKPPSHHPPKL